MRLAVVSLSIVAACHLASAAPPADARSVDFVRDIRPILSDKCFQCHGPSETGRMANLRLDLKEGALAERKNYHIIKPGDASASRLYQRISHEKKPLRMPPPQSGLSLTEKEIDLIKRWIDEGAQWASHWSYTPPVRPELPAVRATRWPRNPIDRFVLARLEAEGLKPSPEAERTTLLRRVTFDLTGLPPTPAEIDAFLKDRAPDAYEKVVDRLLASERYAERMAMHWLDLARYADTHGYHIDSHRDMWPWRDWVIRAFHRNLPWDRFLVEQLAGDLLPNATLEQRIATGFHRNHMINFEGGAIPEEYLNEYVADRVDTTGTVFLGMTLGCARCHDHKYDPIKHREYYQMAAFFNNVNEKGLDGRAGNALPVLQLATPAQQMRLEELACEIEEREARLNDKHVDALIAAWEPTADIPADPRRGIVAHYEMDGSLADVSGHYRHGRLLAGDIEFTTAPAGAAATFNGEDVAELGDTGSFKGPFSVAVWLRSNGVSDMIFLDRGKQWAIAADESVATGDLNRGSHLFFTVAGRTVRTAGRVYGNNWAHLTFGFDGKAARIWVDGKPHPVLEADPPLQASANTLRIPRGFKGQVDDLRLFDRLLEASEIEALALHFPARATLAVPAAARKADHKRRLREYFLKRHAPEYERLLFAQLTEMRLEQKQLNAAIPSVMVMHESPKPRDTHVLARGDYRNRGEKVTPGVPSVLPPLPAGEPANRLTLAKWLVDPNHPLTARVAVNRFWALYFGTGLVKTVEDFGSQGELPSHPELLDWLATEFIRTGWDVKAMQRLIVTSATYRQSSRTRPELTQRDPENRLLARGPRVRLQAEMIRDAALSAAGLLDGKVGGPSVFPYSPKRLWEDIAFGDVYSAQTYPESKPEDLHRRSMYTFWKRTAPPATLSTFDAPDREKCTARRPVTNTPLQALALMNDPTFVEAARLLAQRMLLEAPKADAARLRYGFRLATGRVPSSRELAVLQSLAASVRSGYASADNAAALLAVGAKPADPGLAPQELAAWTVVASAMLNLDEFVTKE